MPQSASLTISAITRGDLDLMVEWAAHEGWNPGLADADCFHATDPEGFLVGRLGNDPIGCISVVAYGSAFGFLGFYIVKPDLRGRGYGLSLWQAGIARLGGRIIGLDGVIAQQANYRQSGFVLAHRNIRFGGTVESEPVSDRRIVSIGADLVEAVIAYDRAFFPAPREAFLRCWLRPLQRQAMALIDSGTLRGYGVIRACRDGYKIGPLFADTEAAAELLFRALAATAEGQKVFLDCPEPNRSATDLAARFGLESVFETARMYRGAAPVLPLSRSYGITTFELG